MSPFSLQEDLTFDADSVFGDEIQSDNLEKYCSMKNLMKFHKPPPLKNAIQQQSSLKNLMKFSRPEWWLLVPGITSYIMIGILLSAVYVLMSEALEVSWYICTKSLLFQFFNYCSLSVKLMQMMLLTE